MNPMIVITTFMADLIGNGMTEKSRIPKEPIDEQKKGG